MARRFSRLLIAACKRMPMETGAPGWAIGFGAVWVGGSGGGESVAAICSSEMCVFGVRSRGASARGCGVGARAMVAWSLLELCGSCDSGRPLSLLLATTAGVVLAAAFEAGATALPGIAVATRYWLQFLSVPPASRYRLAANCAICAPAGVP